MRSCCRYIQEFFIKFGSAFLGFLCAVKQKITIGCFIVVITSNACRQNVQQNTQKKQRVPKIKVGRKTTKQDFTNKEATEVLNAALGAEKVAAKAEKTALSLEEKLRRMEEKLAKRDQRLARVHETAKGYKQVVSNVKRDIGKFANAADGGVVNPALDVGTLVSEVNPEWAYRITGKSNYLESLLLPETGAATIPDDVVRLHSKRSETITYNLKMIDPGSSEPESVSGLMILYPNHPTSLVGYNYLWNSSTNKYVFSQQMNTAQELGDAYDYGRRSSLVLKAQSSTLPSGMYAINGTFNAVRIDGCLSELDLWNDMPNLYSSILSNTTNLLDKCGNVSVGDGVVCLALPDTFQNPYTRFNDSSPISVTDFSTLGCICADSSQDLIYKASLSSGSTTIESDVTWTVNMNCDSTTGFYYQLTLNPTVVLTESQVNGNSQLQVNMTVLDIFGATIGYVQHFSSWQYTPTETTSQLYFNVSGFWDPVMNALNGDDHGPVGAVNFDVVWHAQSIPTFTGGTIGFTSSGSGEVYIRVPLGAKPGVNQSVVLMAYQNVAANSVITVGGIANFELIPNPQLRRNLETTYGHHDPKEMDFVKFVMCNRAHFEIKSVMNAREYERLKPIYKLLCEPKKSMPEVAGALTWGDIKKFGKKALPFLSGGIKALAPSASGIVDTVSGILANSAGGTSIARMHAATRDIKMPVRGRSLSKKVRKAIPPQTPREKRITQARACSVVPAIKAERAVLFPTLETDMEDRAYGFALYAAVPGIVANSGVSARTLDGYTVSGLLREEGVNFATGSDLTLFRVNPARLPELCPIPGPEVFGRSCDAAMWLAGHGEFKGLYPVAFTGELRVGSGGVPIVQDNEFYDIKQAFCHSIGLELLGHNMDADMRITNMRDFLSVRPDLPKFKKPSKTIAKANARELFSVTGLRA